MIGETIAHYRITSKLGEGGMGVVYRAIDTHLDRPVAIKILRAEALADPERKHRFILEAKSASALNHPNIITIHDINHAGDVDFIVMECVRGRPLDEVIGRRGLPLSEALKYAVQIADALAKAHSISLVHRDLKPANIMVSDDGLIKVLDFGLAKLLQPENNDSPAATQTATRAGTQTMDFLDPACTREGVIVGTAAYMSPEQAEGKKIDARSDIFSFGAVLYEMIAGRRAFQGDTGIQTLRAVLLEQPEPLTDVVEGCPPELDRVVFSCLQKDPARRLQHMSDVKNALLQLKEDSDAARLPSPLPASPRPKVTLPRIIAVTAVLLAAAVALAWWVFRPGRAVTHTPLITRLTTGSGLTAYPALSPDGKLLAYASDRATDGDLDIWIQQIAGGNPIRLTTKPADDIEPSFSPDSTRIVFRSEREGGGVYIVPTLGGVEQRIADLGRGPRFSPDGKWIAYWVGDQSYFGRRRMFVVPAAGGEPRQIQPGFFFASHPIWSADSAHLLFRGIREMKQERVAPQSDWWVTPLDGGEAVKTGAFKTLESSAVPAMERSQLAGVWAVEASDWIGDSIFFSAASGPAAPNGSLWRVAISSRFQVEGPAQRLSYGTENALQPSAAGARIAFASLMQNENIWSLPVNPNTAKVSGELRRLTNSAASDIIPTVSADGKRIAFASNRTGALHAWVKDLDTGVETAVAATPGSEIPWLFTPDGSRVVYCPFDVAGALPVQGCFITPVMGGASRTFCKDCPSSGLQDWFGDDSRFLYKRGLPGGRLILRDVDSGRERLFLEHPKYSVTAARFSPDYRWMSFQTVIEAASKRQIFVVPIRNGAAAAETEWIPITDGSGLDRNAVWSPDGNLLYFLSERDGFRCFWAQRLDARAKRPVGAPFAVYHFHQARRSLMPAQEVVRIGLSVTHDKLVFSMAETTGNIWLDRLE